MYSKQLKASFSIENRENRGCGLHFKLWNGFPMEFKGSPNGVDRDSQIRLKGNPNGVKGALKDARKGAPRDVRP